MKFPVDVTLSAQKFTISEAPVVGALAVIEASNGDLHIELAKSVRIVVDRTGQVATFEKIATGPTQWLQEWVAGDQAGVQVWSDQKPYPSVGRRMVKAHLGLNQ